MRILIVTEKANPALEQRDGGARLVNTLLRYPNAQILSFGANGIEYPYQNACRFRRRINNADFIAKKVSEQGQKFDLVVFVHASMAFGLKEYFEIPNILFPMFLTPSYEASGESVPPEYTAAERRALRLVERIITPSHFERRQIVRNYGVKASQIRVIPRGVDLTMLNPKIRSDAQRHLRLASVGSIKPQKGTLRLVRLFHLVRQSTSASLKIIGPTQDTCYAESVLSEIQRLNLGKEIEIVGYIAPSALSDELEAAHIHVSGAYCETFGRSIFETLALGIPNVSFSQDNAAAEYLMNVPFAHFVDEEKGFVSAILKSQQELEQLSSMSRCIGDLFDDDFLGRLLIAELTSDEVLGLSDYDGTLFHKSDPERTRRSVEYFSQFPLQVICSARPVGSLVVEAARIGLRPNYLIGLSGAQVADGQGRILWQETISENLQRILVHRYPRGQWVQPDGLPLQRAIQKETTQPCLLYRAETYQGHSFLLPYTTSKLRSVIRLLREELDWKGRVRAFGDGSHDYEYLSYFDGTLIGQTRKNTFLRQSSELSNVHE